MRRSRAILSLVLVLLVSAAGCGGSDEGSGNRPTVVATTGILAAIAQEVGGARIEVSQLVPDGGSPHDFQLSAQARLDLEDADLVVANGAGLEAGIPLDDADPLWQLADNVGPLLPFDEGAGDPHVWMDPSRVARALPSLAAALADAAPENSAEYRRRAHAFATRLARVDDVIRRMLEPIPASGRELVTSHDALGYFADRYGLRVVATAFPASGPEAQVSAEALSGVEEAVQATGVPMVFAADEDDPETLRIVAEDTGVRVEDGLHVESSGEAGYPGMLVVDARLIAAGLGG